MSEDPIPVGARFSPPLQSALGPPSLISRHWFLAAVERQVSGIGRPPPLVPRLKKEQSIPLLQLWFFAFCTLLCVFLILTEQEIYILNLKHSNDLLFLMTEKLYPIMELAVTLFLGLGRVLSQDFTGIIKMQRVFCEFKT